MYFQVVRDITTPSFYPSLLPRIHPLLHPSSYDDLVIIFIFIIIEVELWVVDSYQKYVMLDPLGVTTKTRAAIEEEASSMADAPSTIMQSEEMHKQYKENFFYMPNMGDVPEIAVPDFLPNLLGKYQLYRFDWFKP